MTQHLYNLAGDFVAFRRDDHDQHVFSATRPWLGWMSHSGQDVYNLAGHYLASVVDDPPPMLIEMIFAPWSAASTTTWPT